LIKAVIKLHQCRLKEVRQTRLNVLRAWPLKQKASTECWKRQ